ncbi:winged helix-turn-helix domain-containing protein [Sedimentitalea sp. JM2-8]|uniref:Winged helix-turn-helix domain-containing protein n=1 Tax=Sedimentitalea xiamensis TaxID=3050037 RepID=A0ABT7FL91_9RHOB|nr:winged helix-turn-helix domain-containing protein [Sedimentitalea xiamensis]MDK3075891.1 winged helix-turn-helix domain-containing protein [Sedimentitalea xiamensis]
MDQYRFDDFILDRRKRQLLCGPDVVRVGARAFDLLEMLVMHRDRIVSRDEIMQAVWPGTIVGDNNLNVQVANLRRLLGADAIVTVPGRGLHFALDVLPDATALALPGKPSVVVLPFDMLGGDPDLDWLADGFVEDITTELSRFRDLFVVARNSAFAYRHTPRDLRAIALELGVRYVVKGSVRARADRVRVTAQLIDATNGGHVWAESFDRDMADHFEMQARVARAIVTCLSPQIDRAEAERIRVIAPEDLTAHGLAQQGWSVISSGEMAYDRGLRDQAEDLARRALARNDASALAWRVLAWVAWWHVYHGTTDSVPDTLATGIDAATRAIAIEPTDHQARRLRAQLHLMNQDVAAGLPELRQAHEMNPNCAVTLCWLGIYEAINGNADIGVPLAEAGIRRSPRDPARGSMLCALGFAQFAARNYAATAECAEAALAESANGTTPLILGTIAYVGLGQIEKAAETFRRVQRIAPKLVEARLSGRWLSANPDYLTRAHTFFRIAAGLAPPQAADALR